jgi:hypothetical protein
MVIQDPAVAAIWRKGSESLGLLDEEERTRMDFLLIDFFWAFATIWIQVDDGLATKSFWETASSNIAIYAGPGTREWWSSSPHRSEYPPGFRERVDAILKLEGA